MYKRQEQGLPFTGEEDLNIFGEEDFSLLSETLLSLFRYFFDDPVNVRFRKLLLLSQFENRRAWELYRKVYCEYPLEVQAKIFSWLMEAGIFQKEMCIRDRAGIAEPAQKLEEYTKMNAIANFVSKDGKLSILAMKRCV